MTLHTRSAEGGWYKNFFGIPKKFLCFKNEKYV